ncbi:hypothetical protein E2C01_055942 [Portunus trituberculatus]|uniref:Uncharacterized protein n=1 Tax=Portunus trituberculatus TaxID=210409 RepID=A0A5B7GWW7_PORTR|nr:hypothetical protein [Portunus trituberculatus]
MRVVVVVVVAVLVIGMVLVVTVVVLVVVVVVEVICSNGLKVDILRNRCGRTNFPTLRRTHVRRSDGVVSQDREARTRLRRHTDEPARRCFHLCCLLLLVASLDPSAAEQRLNQSAD